jgi:hypothetical protein
MRNLLRLASAIEATVFIGPAHIVGLFLTTMLTTLLIGYRFLSRGYYRTFFQRREISSSIREPILNHRDSALTLSLFSNTR